MSILSYIKLDIEWFTHRPLVMRKGSGSMYCLFRLLPKPMLVYCQFNSHGYISITFYNFKYFIQKSILKMPPAVWRAFWHRFCRQSCPKSRPQTLHPPMLVNVECRKKNIRVINSLLFIRECSDWFISVMNAFSRIFHSVNIVGYFTRVNSDKYPWTMGDLNACPRLLCLRINQF